MKKRSITILYNSPVILTFALLSLLRIAFLNHLRAFLSDSRNIQQFFRL